MLQRFVSPHFRASFPPSRQRSDTGAIPNALTAAQIVPKMPHMKKITFTRHVKLVPSTAGAENYNEAAQDLLETARINKLEIIDAALTVEDNLSAIVGHYFFPTLTEKKLEFLSLVVGSDWCSFSAKRKLVSHIITETKILENFIGIKQDELENFLGKTMDYRNAFTHGKFSTDGKTVWLDYYKAKPIKKELTDEYLDKVKKAIDDAQFQTHVLAARLGALA